MYVRNLVSILVIFFCLVEGSLFAMRRSPRLAKQDPKPEIIEKVSIKKERKKKPKIEKVKDEEDLEKDVAIDEEDVEEDLISAEKIELEEGQVEEQELVGNFLNIELPSNEQCIEFLKKWGYKVGFQAQRWSKKIYRWMKIDTSLIDYNVICGDFDRIELHGFDKNIVEIKTYDGFTVIVPTSFLKYTDSTFQDRKIIDLSDKSFATGNALYVIFSALTENSSKINNQHSEMSIDHAQFEMLAMKYWGEIMLLAKYLGIADENISSLREFMSMSIHQLVAREIDKIVATMSVPFAQEVDLHEEIKDLVMQALVLSIDN